MFKVFGHATKTVAQLLFVSFVFIGLSNAVLSQSTPSIEYEYDDHGRLIEVRYLNDGIKYLYTYDKSGNRLSETVEQISNAPSFAIEDATVTEGGSLSFSVVKTGTTTGTYSVSYATANGTAETEDYTALSGSLSFGPSETIKTITVATVADDVYEDTETVLVNLSSASGGATISDNQGSGSITNDDSAPTINFWSDGAGISEGDAKVIIIAKNGASELEHSVTFHTSDGSAIAGTHYTGVNTTITFPVGDAFQDQSITIYTTENTTCGPAHVNFGGNLSAPTNGATLLATYKSYAIRDDDVCETPPAFSVNNVSVSEGGALNFTVTKTGTVSSSFSVNYSTANGSAESSDYTSASGTLTFTAAETSKTVSVATVEDTIYEGAETVLLNLSGATGGATISDSQGSGSITNDDSAPTLNFWSSGANITEGASRSIWVAKNGASELPHTVTFSTSNGTALAGTHYVGISTTLTFPVGDDYQEQTLSISTIGNTSCGGNKSFYANLSSPSNGATLINTQKTFNIIDDDNCYTYSWYSGLLGGYSPAACTGNSSRTQTRTVYCRRSDGTQVSDGYCSGSKPPSSLSSSCLYNFSYGTWGPWGTCSAGGTQTSTRSASCVSSTGNTVSNSYCGTPITTQSQSCTPPISYSWDTTLWTGWSCSAVRYQEIRRRAVSCKNSSGVTVSDSNCSGTKPTSVETQTNYSCQGRNVDL